MPNDSPQVRQEKLSPRQIRSAVFDALEDIGWTPGIADKDTEIVKTDLIPVLEKLSKRIRRRVILGKPPRKGWRLNVTTLTSLVWELQVTFEPIPPAQPEEPTPNSTP